MQASGLPRVRVHGGSRILLERLANLPVRLVAEGEAADVAVLTAPELPAIADGRVVDANGTQLGNPAWTLGLPRLTPTQPDAIARASRVAVPSAAVAGALLLLRPLQEAGMLPGGEIEIAASGDVPAADAARAVARHSMLPVAPRFTLADGPAEAVTVRVEVPGSGQGAERARAILGARYEHANHIRVVPPGDSEAENAEDPDRIALAIDPDASANRLLLSARVGRDRTNTVIQVLALMLGLETADEAPLLEQSDDQ